MGLVENQYRDIMEMLEKFKTFDEFTQLKDKLLEFAKININIEEASVCSPTISIRQKRFQSTKQTLKILSSDEIGRITKKQYVLFMELYTHEDMNLLGAWEVFNLTNDIEDFIDTLFIIEKSEFFNERTEGLEGINETKEIEKTLKI